MGTYLDKHDGGGVVSIRGTTVDTHGLAVSGELQSELLI